MKKLLLIKNMEENMEWTNLKNPQKYDLFMKYVKKEIEKNETKYIKKEIDNLIYFKNKFFLQNIKKDKIIYKKLEDDDIIINNNTLIMINQINKNDDGLFYIKNIRRIEKRKY